MSQGNFMPHKYVSLRTSILLAAGIPCSWFIQHFPSRKFGFSLEMA